MATVQLNQPAPDFTVTDYKGNEMTFSQFKGHAHVLIVLNRGFV